MKGITGPFAMFFDVLDTFPMIKKLWDQFVGGFALVVQAFEPMGAILEPVSRVIAMAFTGIAHSLGAFFRSKEGLEFVEKWTNTFQNIALSIGAAFMELYKSMGGARGMSNFLIAGMLAITTVIKVLIDVATAMFQLWKMIVTGLAAVANVIINIANMFIELRNIADKLTGGKGDMRYIEAMGNPYEGIDSLNLVASDLLGDDTKDNTDAIKENTAAIRDFQREFRNLPSGFKVNAAMYRASNGVGPKGKTPYAPKDTMGEYTPPPTSAEAARRFKEAKDAQRRAKEEAARNPNRIEM
jgi:hypothetical protein